MCIRKAKNNYRIAQETYKQKQLELEKLSREAWQDWQGYLKQTVQMVEKVEADSIAYQLTKRQFEEGLSTAIDLRTTSAQLLNSKATLLQCQLMAMVKEQLVRYYIAANNLLAGFWQSRLYAESQCRRSDSKRGNEG